MIQLDKVTLQIGQKLFSQSTKKFIRIQAQPSKILITKNIAKPISQTNLQWDEVIQLPFTINKKMPFQIYEKHEFGYNPEEISSIMHGKIIFDERSQKFYNWQVFNSKQKKIGYLSVNVKEKPQDNDQTQKLSINNKEITPLKGKKKIIDETQLVIISSIVVNIPLIKAKRAYALLTVGHQNVRTLPVKSKLGELVFVQKYELQKNPRIQEAQIDIYSCGIDQPDLKIASATIKLEKKIDRKLKFFDPQETTKEIGEGFVDGKVQLKSEVISDRLFASIIKKGIQNEFQPVQTNVNKPNNLSRSIVVTNRSFLNTNGSSNSPFTSSKKFSVVNQNTNIKIPQQRRFFTSRDPLNNKCSYLPEQSFQFKEKKIDKYYRGASIGYGNKVDFTVVRKQVPSVGKYNLPSIWDRY